MIIYEPGEYQLAFIMRADGSTLPKAAAFAMPSVMLAMMSRYFIMNSEYGKGVLLLGQSVVWTVVFFVLGTLIGFRCNKAYARFWEGCTLVQAMSAEWFEACSNLIAFSKMQMLKNPPGSEKFQEKMCKVRDFQFRLIRLMSLLHGMALRQIGGNDGEEFEVLDIFGLDDESLDYLTNACSAFEINRVEVLLHWIQVLITDSISSEVLIVPPPILTRAYQTLSRGMVNLHNVRKIADIPFPFPLSQMVIVLLLIQSIVTPVLVSCLIHHYVWCAVITFLPIMGMWSLVFICGQLEQPFGTDANDLPLSMQQFDFNNSLVMLVDERAMEPPKLKAEAAVTVEELRALFGNPNSKTDVLYPEDETTPEITYREYLRNKHVLRASGQEGDEGQGKKSEARMKSSALKNRQSSSEVSNSSGGSKGHPTVSKMFELRASGFVEASVVAQLGRQGSGSSLASSLRGKTAGSSTSGVGAPPKMVQMDPHGVPPVPPSVAEPELVNASGRNSEERSTSPVPLQEHCIGLPVMTAKDGSKKADVEMGLLDAVPDDIIGGEPPPSKTGIVGFGFAPVAGIAGPKDKTREPSLAPVLEETSPRNWSAFFAEPGPNTMAVCNSERETEQMPAPPAPLAPPPAPPPASTSAPSMELKDVTNRRAVKDTGGFDAHRRIGLDGQAEGLKDMGLVMPVQVVEGLPLTRRHLDAVGPPTRPASCMETDQGPPVI